jgi:hypothetical protein
VIVGIAVAKAALDVAIRPSGEARQLAHDAAGIGALGEVLRKLPPGSIWLRHLTRVRRVEDESDT